MILKKMLLLLMVIGLALAFYGVTGCNPSGKKGVATLTVTTTSLPPGQVGTAYEYTLKATGGSWPYVWSIEETGSTLPPGLYLSESGNITGTPTTEGSHSFTAQVSDAHNEPRSASENLSIVVYPKGEVAITTGALAPAYVSQAYDGQLQAVGGEEPYTWSIASGGVSATELVPNLFLSTSGNVTGSPTTSGVYIVEIRVDEFGGSFDTKNITITVNEPQVALAITSSSPLPNYSLASGSYSTYIGVVGGVGNYRWALETGSAPFPGNFGINLTTGEITGTSAPQTEHSFSIIVTDDGGAGTSVTKVFKLNVIP